MKRSLAYVVSLIALLSVVGCDDLDRTFDCKQICDTFRECFAADYDVDACADRCEENAEESEAFDDRADDCESCLDGRACSGTFSCIDECIGIVP